MMPATSLLVHDAALTHTAMKTAEPLTEHRSAAYRCDCDQTAIIESANIPLNHSSVSRRNPAVLLTQAREHHVPLNHSLLGTTV